MLIYGVSPKQKFLLFLIILLAIFFRFYLIRQMPGGLFPDMAANGLDINLMQQGQLQPFYERGNGREALFFYMEWASVALFGKGVWQFSIVPALVGVLAVLACFFVTRRLFMLGGSSNESKNSEDGLKKVSDSSSLVPSMLTSTFNQIQGKFSEFNPSLETENRATSIALLAAFLMAASSWHVVLSRTAFRATLIPLFSALVIYFLLSVYESNAYRARAWFAFLCGASFALGFYTYIAFRIMAPILFMVILWPFLASIKTKRIKAVFLRYFMPVVSFLVAFVIFIFPIAKYFYTHPGSFLGRSGQVSIFNPSLYTVNGITLTDKPPLITTLNVLVEVTKQSLLGFFTQGDLNWRHNVSGAPFLSQVVSPFFGVGLGLITLMGIGYFFMPNKRSGWWKYFLLTGWFWGMLLPVVTTAEGIPHGLRSVGLIPPVFIISAWMIYTFVRYVKIAHEKIWHRCEKCHDQHYESTSRLFRKTLVWWGFKLVAVCFFLTLVLQTYFLYFIYAYNSAENFYYFRSDLSSVSEYLVARCEKDHTYLVLDTFSVQTTDYLTSDRYGNFSSPCSVPYKQVDPERSWQLSGLRSGDQIVFAQSSIFDIKKFKQYHPSANLIFQHGNKFGQAELAVYEVQ